MPGLFEGLGCKLRNRSQVPVICEAAHQLVQDRERAYGRRLCGGAFGDLVRPVDAAACGGEGSPGEVGPCVVVEGAAPGQPAKASEGLGGPAIQRMGPELRSEASVLRARALWWEKASERFAGSRKLVVGSKEVDHLFDGISRELPKHGSEVVCEGIVDVSSHGVSDCVGEVFEEPAIRSAPLQRQIDSELSESGGCGCREQLVAMFIHPVGGDVTEKADPWGQDRAVLRPIPVLQSEDR